MKGQSQYNTDEVCMILQQFTSLTIQMLQLLDNSTNYIEDLSEGDFDMSKRIKQCVEINGNKHWVTGDNPIALMEAYLQLCISEGIVVPPIVAIGQNGRKQAPKFGDYLLNFVSTYKTNQGSSTMINRMRIINNHIIPKFGDTPINEITTGDIQRWFNDLAKKYSKETILKIRNTASPAFDAAIEEGIITRNPFKSKLIEINGKETVSHRALPHEKLIEIRKGLNGLDIRERYMAVLLTSTGMRFEEVLGLRWEDIDFQNGWIDIRRAVIHPSRNYPEVKETKTKSSARRIPLDDFVRSQLFPIQSKGFILYSYSDQEREKPLSYTEARRSFDKIRSRFHIEGYTAHDFRDTCATEWREQGIPTDVIARLLGHTKSEITEKKYVKYRSELFDGVREIWNKNWNSENSEKIQVPSSQIDVQ